MTAKRPTLSIKPSAPKAAPRVRASYEVKPVLQPGYRLRVEDYGNLEIAIGLNAGLNTGSQSKGGR